MNSNASANIKEITAYVAATQGITKLDAEGCISAAFAYIKDSLSEGRDVNVHGFGKFVTERKAERIGRNPATGADLVIAAKTVVKFKPSTKLKSDIQ